jgi:hypothetical protein
LILTVLKELATPAGDTPPNSGASMQHWLLKLSVLVPGYSYLSLFVLAISITVLVF